MQFNQQPQLIPTDGNPREGCSQCASLFPKWQTQQPNHWLYPRDSTNITSCIKGSVGESCENSLDFCPLGKVTMPIFGSAELTLRWDRHSSLVDTIRTDPIGSSKSSDSSQFLTHVFLWEVVSGKFPQGDQNPLQLPGLAALLLSPPVDLKLA